MSLANRLSAFFLAALALVLLGFSGTLYLLARVELARQLDDRLERALDTLEASVDIEPKGLEWEPADRRLVLGVDAEVDEPRWAVLDGAGGPVDRSANLQGGDFPVGWRPRAWPAAPPDGTAWGTAPGWRLGGRRLELATLLRQGRGHPNDEPGYEVQYRALILLVGLSPAPAEATLGRLGWALILLSAGVWAAAAAIGRRLGARALAPLSRMATAAAAMGAADLGPSLPAPGTGDELDELGRAFNDLLGRLRAAFDERGRAYERQRRFAGDASHQLRTPLAALLGQVQVALRRDRDPDEYRRVLRLVRDEGDRLRLLVESLLALARPADDRPDGPTLDLAAWVAHHLARRSSHPRGADLRFETGPEGAGLVRAQGELLGQLLDNLIENAWKYGDPGTPVVVRARLDGDSACLEVEDRGPGLDPADAARVFEPFFRAEAARRAGLPGVGLGLAVAARVAEALGGTLDVRSEPGRGSTFTLRLPRAAPPVAGAGVARGTSDLAR